MAGSVAGDSKTYPELEGWSRGEAYGLPLNAKSLIGSMMANLCGSHYPLHMAMVEASSQRILVDKAFSVPKCVRLARNGTKEILNDWLKKREFKGAGVCRF